MPCQRTSTGLRFYVTNICKSDVRKVYESESEHLISEFY